MLYEMLRQILRKDFVPGTIGKLFNIQPEDIARITTNPGETLEFFVLRFLPFASTNPLDKVYSPRALVSAAYPHLASSLPPVDYTADVTKVYTDYAGFIFERSSTLELLSYAKEGNLKETEQIGNLPSWVPNLSETKANVLFDIPGTCTMNLKASPLSQTLLLTFHPSPRHELCCFTQCGESEHMAQSKQHP